MTTRRRFIYSVVREPAALLDFSPNVEGALLPFSVRRWPGSSNKKLQNDSSPVGP